MKYYVLYKQIKNAYGQYKHLRRRMTYALFMHYSVVPLICFSKQFLFMLYQLVFSLKILTGNYIPIPSQGIKKLQTTTSFCFDNILLYFKKYIKVVGNILYCNRLILDSRALM